MKASIILSVCLLLVSLGEIWFGKGQNIGTVNAFPSQIQQGGITDQRINIIHNNRYARSDEDDGNEKDSDEEEVVDVKKDNLGLTDDKNGDLVGSTTTVDKKGDMAGPSPSDDKNISSNKNKSVNNDRGNEIHLVHDSQDEHHRNGLSNEETAVYVCLALLIALSTLCGYFCCKHCCCSSTRPGTIIYRHITVPSQGGLFPRSHEDLGTSPLVRTIRIRPDGGIDDEIRLDPLPTFDELYQQNHLGHEPPPPYPVASFPVPSQQSNESRI